MAGALLAFIGFLWTACFIKETNPEGSDGRKPFKPRMKNLLGFMQLFGKHPKMNMFTLWYTWFDLAQQTGPVFAVTSRTLFGYDMETVARWLSIYGFGMAFAPGVITKFNVKHLG